MTRNWCNQNQRLAIETKMGKNLIKLLIDTILRKQTVNRMNSSFPKGGNTATET